MDQSLELLIGEERIRVRVAALGRHIETDYRGRPLSLVVVLKGAAVFAADLARRIDLPLRLEFITAASYGVGTTSSGRVRLAGLDGLDVAGRDVLLIEDILDSGRTSGAIIDRLAAQEPASLAICALLRKPAAAALDLPVYAVGFDIADDFVVGYGMDHAEHYRNLRGIHRLPLDRGAVPRQDDDDGPSPGR